MNNKPTPCRGQAMDDAIPGGVYLCQVDDKVSCGACCGLYNTADIAENSLKALLAQRTEAFRRAPRTVGGIEDFSLWANSRHTGARPFKHFHHCPFIGLMGDGATRVGCLLHPLADGNNGLDYRGLSYYGGMACRTYFCPTVHQMHPRFKKIVRGIAVDWYFYGLLTTEKRLLEALFYKIEDSLKKQVDINLFEAAPQATECLRSLFALKLDWPYRPATHNTPCHYFFNDRRHARPFVNYADLSVAPSEFDTILEELGSVFKTRTQLRHAEQRIADSLEAVVGSLISRSVGERP